MAAVQAAENHGDFQTSFHEFYEKFKMAKFGTCETVCSFYLKQGTLIFGTKLGQKLNFTNFISINRNKHI